MSSEFHEFVVHPRYGQGPRISGLNPQDDYATVRVCPHWHSPENVRIPNTAILADLSRQTPGTISITHYFDAKRQCVDCRKPFIFFAAEQKYWYEELGFSLDSDCVRCVLCRKKQQGLDRSRQRYEELFHIEARSPEQNREMAECSLSLVEAGIFGRKQVERVRAILKSLGEEPKLQTLWMRVHAIENGG